MARGRAGTIAHPPRPTISSPQLIVADAEPQILRPLRPYSPFPPPSPVRTPLPCFAPLPPRSPACTTPQGRPRGRLRSQTIGSVSSVRTPRPDDFPLPQSIPSAIAVRSVSGSPKQRPSKSADVPKPFAKESMTCSNVSLPCSIQGSVSAAETPGSGPLKPKASKWKALGSLFTATKKPVEPAQQSPFYHLQTQSPASACQIPQNVPRSSTFVARQARASLSCNPHGRQQISQLSPLPPPKVVRPWEGNPSVVVTEDQSSSQQGSRLELKGESHNEEGSLLNPSTSDKRRIPSRSQTTPVPHTYDQNTLAPHPMPQRAETAPMLLDVNIPEAELGRYSVMFSDVLGPPRSESPQSSNSSLLARRQGQLENIKLPQDSALKVPTTGKKGDWGQLLRLGLQRRATSPSISPSKSSFQRDHDNVQDSHLYNVKDGQPRRSPNRSNTVPSAPRSPYRGMFEDICGPQGEDHCQEPSTRTKRKSVWGMETSYLSPPSSSSSSSSISHAEHTESRPTIQDLQKPLPPPKDNVSSSPAIFAHDQSGDVQSSQIRESHARTPSHTVADFPKPATKTPQSTSMSTGLVRKGPTATANSLANGYPKSAEGRQKLPIGSTPLTRDIRATERPRIHIAQMRNPLLAQPQEKASPVEKLDAVAKQLEWEILHPRLVGNSSSRRPFTPPEPRLNKSADSTPRTVPGNPYASIKGSKLASSVETITSGQSQKSRLPPESFEKKHQAAMSPPRKHAPTKAIPQKSILVKSNPGRQQPQRPPLITKGPEFEKIAARPAKSSSARSPTSAIEEAQELIKGAARPCDRRQDAALRQHQLLVPIIPTAERIVNRQPRTATVVQSQSRKSTLVCIEQA